MQESPVRRRRLVTCFIGMLPVLAALTAVHLWPDEEPLPETRIYRALQSPAPGPRSWFHGAYGFFARGDVFERGRRLAVSLQETGVHDRTTELSIRVSASACIESAMKCTAGMSPSEVLQLLADHRELLDHYLDLYRATDFAFVLPATLDLQMPPLKELLAVQRLVHAGIRADPDVSIALLRADQDFAHWRRVLGGTNTFISKLVAVQAVSQALDLREQLIDQLDATARARVTPLSRLSAAEASMTTALQFELGIDHAAMMDIDSFLSEWSGPGPGFRALLPMKPHATFNRHLRNYAQVLAMTQMSRDQLVAALAMPPSRLPAVTAWDYLFNGRGVWMLEQADATEKYGEYMLALRDLEARVAAQTIPR